MKITSNSFWQVSDVLQSLIRDSQEAHTYHHSPGSPGGGGGRLGAALDTGTKGRHQGSTGLWSFGVRFVSHFHIIVKLKILWFIHYRTDR